MAYDKARFFPGNILTTQRAPSVIDNLERNAFIETTLHEKFYGIRKEYDLLCKIRAVSWRLTEVEVAKAYNGGNARRAEVKASENIMEMSEIVMRLEMCVINLMETLRTRKGTISIWKKRKHLQTSDDTLNIAELDYWKFKIFLSFHFLCASPAFHGERITDI